MVKIILNLKPNSEGFFTYYPGHLLKGSVDLRVNQAKKIRGLYVKVFGKATAHWSVTHFRYTEYFKGEEVFFNSTVWIHSILNSGALHEIQPGSHNYKFAFQLPKKLPYSLEIRHGEVKYFIEVILDIPWSFNEGIKEKLKIIPKDDLNLYPQLKLPLTQEKVKHFFTLLDKSDSLNMNVTIPYTGYAILQNVPLKISYKNKSNVDILSTEVKLMQQITFNSQKPKRRTKVKRRKVLTNLVSGVKAGKSREIEANFTIPGDVMNSNEKMCRVVIISYYIEVEGISNGLRSNPKVTLPITIGTIPLRIEENSVVTANSSIQSPERVVEPPEDDLPPSYEEVMRNALQ